MSAKITVETQGVSDDWANADDNFEVKSRGLLRSDQMLSAMLHLSQLDTPDGDDPCAPQIMTLGPAGSFSFIGQGGTIFCPDTDTDTELTAHQACDVAFGQRSAAPPPPMPSAPRVSSATAPKAVSHVAVKRKFGLRGGIVLFLSLCFFVGALVMAFGVSSMKNRGMPEDDILAAITISGALVFIGVLMFFLALKARRTEYFNDNGTRVAEDGSALPFVAMAQSFDGSDDGDDGFDGDFD